MVEINDIEKDIIKFWNKKKIFEKSLENTKNGKAYIFYDGPPFATGLPHYGHLLASILKDVFPRFFTMNGRYVKRNWGWDCHGLPVECIVEKELNINSKSEIEKMGVKKFNDNCRKSVLTFTKEWEKFVDRIGRWVDFKDGYKTMDTNYIESVWWAFKQLYEKDYLYRGEKILMYCPRCSTPLAKSEIAMDNSYKSIKDISVVIKLKLKDEDAFALAWTTTPWTLPSNLALAVNPELNYVYLKDKTDNNTYILAKSLIKGFYKSKENYKILKEIKGKDLEGKKYEPLYPYFSNTKNAFKFILGEFVSAEEGTGIVHTAPAFGEDDNIICREYKIPMVQPIDENGNFTEEVSDYAGKYVHDVNEKIADDLKKSGKVVLIKKIEHEYPFCYRCGTKLIYRALPAWFIDIQKIKKKLLKLNEKINWIPEFLKEGRMKNNISTAPDWNVTRNRYWAAAIPIWKSKSGKIKVIGSIEELKKFAKKLPNQNVDLHKDYLDEVKLEIDGEEYSRIPEVLDCWFESGSMTFAQFHYPFENKLFFEKNFPAQFVVEYIGQTRTWFYYMIVLSAILFNKIPFENVLTTGTILAEDGQKMSKSKKNFPDPMKVIEKYGSDSLRFYLLQSPVMNADNFNFSEKGLEEIYKKVILLLYNVGNFYIEYKSEKDLELKKSKNIIDNWILSKTEVLLKEIEKDFKEYNTIKACSKIREYIDGLSTWYIRNSRERFNEEDENAKKTLRYVLEKFVRIIAPIIPFSAEKIFQDLNGSEKSIHLEKWPQKNEKLINFSLEEDMEKVREMVSEGLKQRDIAQIGLKWPLQKATVKGIKKLDKELLEILKAQLNVKEIKYAIENSNENNKISVELDTKLTPELEEEGYAREISRKIQAFRKEIGLEKKEKVNLIISTDELFKKMLENQKDFIKERTNSQTIKITCENIDDKNKKITKFEIKNKFGKICIC